MTGNTVRLHRVLRASPELVYKAFLDPAALAKWMAPHGYVAQVHELDAQAGGAYRMSFVHLASGQGHSFGGRYIELVPGRRIRHTDTFDDPGLPGTMQVTVEFEPVSCGTDLRITQEGVPEVIPLESCYLGWQQSLALLALLVEDPGPG